MNVIDKIEKEMVIKIYAEDFRRNDDWQEQNRYVPLIILIGFLILTIVLLWWNFSTLRKRKRKIKVLESELEMLKSKMKNE